MLKLALCDDEAVQREAISGLLREYAAQRPELAVKLAVFSSGQTLLAAEEDEHFDLYVLDVVMPDTSGIELGVRLRELGSAGAIIFLSVSPEFAVESFAAQAFYYLIKPPAPEQLYQVLDQAVAAMEKRRDACVMVKTKDGTRLVRLDAIQYAELTGRSVRYHLAGGEQVDSVTLRSSFREEMASLLSSSGFFACGASFVVNLYYVHAVEPRALRLDDGGQVPLARGCVVEAKRQWIRYWLDERA